MNNYHIYYTITLVKKKKKKTPISWLILDIYIYASPLFRGYAKMDRCPF